MYFMSIYFIFNEELILKAQIASISKYEYC